MDPISEKGPVVSLGIYADYVYGPAFDYVQQIASFAVRCGLSVSIRARQPLPQTFVPDPVCRVESPRRCSFEAWSRRHEAIAWCAFDRGRLHRAYASLVKQHYLLVASQPVLEASAAFRDRFRAAFTPWPSLLTLTAKDSVANWQVRWAPPVVSSLSGCREAAVAGSQRVFCLADAQTLRRYGDELLTTLERLLASRPQVVLTLGHARLPGWSLRRRLVALQDRFGDRCRVLLKPDRNQRMAAYNESDWTFLPSRHDPFGVYAVESLCAGRPVAAFHAEPLRTLLRESQGGWLLSSTYEAAVPELLAIVDRSLAAVEADCSGWRAPLRRHRTAFESFWRMQWRIEPLDRASLRK